MKPSAFWGLLIIGNIWIVHGGFFLTTAGIFLCLATLTLGVIASSKPSGKRRASTAPVHVDGQGVASTTSEGILESDGGRRTMAQAQAIRDTSR